MAQSLDPSEVFTPPGIMQDSILPNYSYFGFVQFTDTVPGVYSRNTNRRGVYDGDTIFLWLDLGHDTGKIPLAYRLYGIQAPEIERLVSREDAIRSRDFLSEQIALLSLVDFKAPFDEGHWVVVKSHQYKRRRDYRARDHKDRYGRYLVELFGKDADDRWININQRVYEAGHAGLYVP